MKTHSTLSGIALSISAGLGLSPIPCPGQIMLSPVSVTVDENLGTYPGDADAGYMIDQSGLYVPFVSSVTAFDAYFVTPNSVLATNMDGTKWVSETSEDLQRSGNLDFDLGSSLPISKLAIWNVSVKDLLVIIAEDLAGLDTASAVGSYALPSHTASVSYSPTVLDFGSAHQGRFVRLAIQTEHPILPGFDFGYASIGEVVLSVSNGVAPPPALGITREPDGDVTITFTGTLQSATDATGRFEDVPGNPQSAYTIPRTSQPLHQFFRARSE